MDMLLLLNGVPPLPTKPVPSLATIDWGFLQTGDLLRSDCPLSTMFPNLTTLKLKGIMNPLQETAFQGLPPQLRVLHLSCSLVSRLRTIDLPYTVFGLLPETLEELMIVHAQITGGDDVFRSVRLPPHLTSLNIDRLDSERILWHLPPTIESVQLVFSRPSAVMDTFLASKLPPSLRVFHCYPFDLTIDFDVPLPSHLEFFNGEFNCREEDFPMFLVRSLKKLPDYLVNHRVHYIPLLEWCSSLETLRYSDHLDLDYDETLKHLPDRLRSLSLLLHEPSESNFSGLPRTLTELNGVPLSPAQIPNLPTSLNFLEISQDFAQLPTPLLSSSDCLQLPRYLVDVSVFAERLESSTCLEALPHTLTSLTVRKVDPNFFDSGDLSLPPNLRKVVFELHNEYFPNMRW